MTAEDRLDDLAEVLREIAEQIANRNRADMYPGMETWAYLRTEMFRADATIWRTLAAMTGEEVRWPLQN